MTKIIFLPLLLFLFLNTCGCNTFAHSYLPRCKYDDHVIGDDNELFKLIESADEVFTGKVSSEIEQQNVGENVTTVITFSVVVKRFFKTGGDYVKNEEIKLARSLYDGEGVKCRIAVRPKYTAIFIGRKQKKLKDVDIVLTVSPVPVTLNNLDRISTASKENMERNKQQKEAGNISLEGRRLVAIDYFLQQIFSSRSIHSCGCNFMDMNVIKENKLGLKSIITLKCKVCNAVVDLSTDYEGDSHLKVNDAASFGIVSAGIGYSTAKEFMSILNVPFMTFNTFDKCSDFVSESIHSTFWKQIENNGKEEARLARLNGEVDSDGTPCITVVTDGAWSKRSYNVNYNALSGVACIIGKRTQKVLFLSVRNKYCCVCARAENKQMTSGIHKCYKNFTGSSTAMESDIILDGFKQSIEMHGIKYTRLIGDGDSSVLKRLYEVRPYGTTQIEKVECTNHLYRNFAKQIREVSTRKRSTSKNLAVPPYLRKILLERCFQCVSAVKKAVEFRSSEVGAVSNQVTLLVDDLKNIASHVFGEHEKCSEIAYFPCNKTGINYVESMSECGLYEDIKICFQRLVDNAFSLILNMTNNLAEQYNSVVCKFIAGKKINFSQRGTYGTRCEAAAVAFNSGPEYRRFIYKEMVKGSPEGPTKKYIEALKRKSTSKKSCRRRLFKRSAGPDEHYGAENVQLIPDLSAEDFTTKKNLFLKELRKTPEEIKVIEQQTQGQANNPLWYKERCHRITASNFKDICCMKTSTSCVNKVINLLYKPFKGDGNTRYGRRNEMRAVAEFQNVFKLTVEPCGLFIDLEHYMLGASPDGLVGEEACLEIKCPAKAADLHPKDAIIQQKIIYAELCGNDNLRLKRNHAYYYQVQGQLHITNRMYCYFVIWTPLGMLTEKILRDDDFWNTMMVNQLRRFYFKCLLPEIIDPRKSRGMEIRNPPR